MFLLFLILVIATVAFVRRGGQFGPPPWVRRAAQAPETEARSILATRFATGDLSSDEFLERASVLNWTPGVEPVPVPRKRRR